MTIVALPIAIVTSYVLYQRRNSLSWFSNTGSSIGLHEAVILGQERKRLAPPPEEIEAPKG